MQKLTLYLLFFFGVTLLGGCYSLKGITVPVEAKTFTVRQMENNADQVVPGLSEDFTERLINKIKRNTSLSFTENEEADIIFVGSIQSYRVTSKAAQANQQSALNQLKIEMNFEYLYEKDEEIGWTRNFSQQEDFGADENLLDVQDVLNETISKQLVEDIFNAASAEKW